MLCVNQGKNFEPLVLIRLTHLAKLAKVLTKLAMNQKGTHTQRFKSHQKAMEKW